MIRSLNTSNSQRRVKKPKKRNAWLITWEAFPDYRLKDISRPRVVAILKPQLANCTIKIILPVLFISESRLTFSEKVSYSFFRQQKYWLYEHSDTVSCGTNPSLYARKVKNLYVQSYDDSCYHQTLHWTEHAKYRHDPETRKLVETIPEQICSEEVHFDELWYARSFLEENN